MPLLYHCLLNKDQSQLWDACRAAELSCRLLASCPTRFVGIQSSQTETAICSCDQVSPHRKYGWQKRSEVSNRSTSTELTREPPMCTKWGENLIPMTSQSLFTLCIQQQNSNLIVFHTFLDVPVSCKFLQFFLHAVYFMSMDINCTLLMEAYNSKQ